MIRARCDACKAEVIRAHMAQVGWVVIHATPISTDPQPGMIAINPRRGTAHELTIDDVDSGEVWKWAHAGATVHELHSQVCRRAAGGAARPGQEALL